VTARALGAAAVATPVTSNSGVEQGPWRVLRTRVGSPHVLAAMAAEGGRVLGYEANGGVLLGYAAEGPAGPLPALPTRDALLPLVAVLAAAKAAGGLAARLAQEPARFTAATRIEAVAPEAGAALVARLAEPAAAAEFLAGLGARGPEAADRTDGLRWRLAGGGVLHLRPSGNAPEFRLYAEAESPAAAAALLAAARAAAAAALTPPAP
jgi:phosphomannomutase